MHAVLRAGSTDHYPRASHCSRGGDVRVNPRASISCTNARRQLSTLTTVSANATPHSANTEHDLISRTLSRIHFYPNSKLLEITLAFSSAFRSIVVDCTKARTLTGDIMYGIEPSEYWPRRLNSSSGDVMDPSAFLGWTPRVSGSV